VIRACAFLSDAIVALNSGSCGRFTTNAFMVLNQREPLVLRAAPAAADSAALLNFVAGHTSQLLHKDGQ
jgi:hypothetical protein